MLNQVSLVGRVGRAPEVRSTRSGDVVANFSLAIDERFTDRSGEKRKVTHWMHIAAWGKQAENIGKFVEKGHMVGVTGRLKSSEVEKNGTKVTYWEVVADNVSFLTSKAEAQALAAKATTSMQDDEEAPF